MNKLQKDAIAHYNRMIKWAKTQSQNSTPLSHVMNMEIKEGWGGADCSYCRAYLENCDDCSLSKSYRCCNELWYKMDVAKTWSEWIKYAQKIKQYIKDNG